MTPDQENDAIWSARLEDAKNTASHLGIEIEVHDLSSNELPAQSGLCRIRGRNLILLDQRLSDQQQVDVLVKNLKQFDLESIYVPAWLREQVEPSPMTS